VLETLCKLGLSPAWDCEWLKGFREVWENWRLSEGWAFSVPYNENLLQRKMVSGRRHQKERTREIKCSFFSSFWCLFCESFESFVTVRGIYLKRMKLFYFLFRMYLSYRLSPGTLLFGHMLLFENLMVWGCGILLWNSRSVVRWTSHNSASDRRNT
jgi:hypothetical protein